MLPLATHERFSENVWRIPLPSRTLPPYEHTNSYLVQTRHEGVLIDLGTDDPASLAILESLLNERGVTSLRALLLTHTHPDHCAGASWARARFGAPVYAHPLEPFPSEPLGDNETVCGVLAYHTPGHSPGHLSFEVPGALLVGDLLAAQGSTWVGLPGGNVSDYLASLAHVEELVERQKLRVLGPGHGEAVTDPLRRLREVRAHRLEREAQVLKALDNPRALAELRETVYPGLPPEAIRAAEGSLLALLEKLLYEGRVVEKRRTEGEATWMSR